MKGNELNWRKARASSAQNGCVEVAAATGFTGIRDSKAPERGHLAPSKEAFAAFLADAKGGRLDLRLAGSDQPRRASFTPGLICIPHRAAGVCG